MGYLSIFSNNMTASRGWIGIAAQAVGGGNFLIVTLTTGVFAIAQGIVSKLALTALPSDLINTIPYVCVLIGLIGLSIKEYRKDVQDKITERLLQQCSGLFNRTKQVPCFNGAKQ